MPKPKIFFFILAALAFINLDSPKKLFADGMIIPPPFYQVEETAQKAAIWHDGFTETLILSITFRGDAEDFGWIVPVPSEPEVSKASEELFTALEELTLPKSQRYPVPLGIGGYRDAPEKSTVQILETKRVDIYDITVLRSGSSLALTDWFRKNNYPYPEEASYILDDYINNGWYFVAAKISTKFFGPTTFQYLKEGHATPLKIVFNTETIIYPLKISSVISDQPKRVRPLPPPREYYPLNEGFQEEATSPPETTYEENFYPPLPPSAEYVNIVLYVFAEGKRTVPGFNIDYASFLKPEVIKKLAYDEDQQPWMSPTKKMFLTKLVATRSLSEMTTDLILREAEDNRPVNAPQVLDISGWRFATIILIPISLEIILIAYFILKRRIKLW